MLDNLLTQTGRIDMRIDFGRCYALMPEHSLNDTQAGTTFKKMSGKGVTEGVRTDILLNAGIKDKLLYEVKDHYAREVICDAQGQFFHRW